MTWHMKQQSAQTAEGTLESAKSQLGQAREALGDTELRARASGVIHVLGVNRSPQIARQTPVLPLEIAASPGGGQFPAGRYTEF